MAVSSSESVNEPIFTVDKLLHYMGNDQKALLVVGRIIRDALAPGGEPLAQTAAALREGRYQDAARLLHGLRGSVGNLGSRRFCNAAFALEQAIGEQRLAQLPALLSRVESEFALVREHADAWLAQHEHGLPPH